MKSWISVRRTISTSIMPILSRASTSPNGKRTRNPRVISPFCADALAVKSLTSLWISLGASVGLDTKAQNRGLLQAVDDFCAESQLDKNERQNYRQQVYSYCNEQLQAGEEIALEELSNELPPLGEKTFQAFTAEQGYELEEHFPADRGTLRQLTKFAGSGGGVTINFDALLLGERIFWDAATDTLTIKGTPPNLRDQLQRRTSAK